MRRRVWFWLALSSVQPFIAPAATRPRYGGTLTVQLSSVLSSEPDWMSHLVRETLVRLNDAGDPEPELAVSWQRELDGRRWRFTLRPKVLFHDRRPLTAAGIIAQLQDALSATHPGISVTGSGMTVVIQTESATENLPGELSLPRNAVFHRGEGGEPAGTGPFRLLNWEPGRKAVLAAFEDYWGGRPFVDSVIVNTGPLPRQISATAADIWELPVASSRRVLPESMRLWSSVPIELVAIVPSGVPPPVREALALSIDRAPIVNVLIQRRGEAAASLLPQWLTGYAFLFSAVPDQARARQLLASVRIDPLALSYPVDDSLARSIAERISLNARDVGLNVQPTTNPNANLRLIRTPLPSCDAALDLTALTAVLGLQVPANLSTVEARYNAERAFIDDHSVIPLAYLPQIYGVGPRVHNWDLAQRGKAVMLHLENVWVSQ